MCGLVGIAGKLGFQDEFTMKRLLLADYFRGQDSTGMAAIRSNGDCVTAKIASNPIDLFFHEHFKRALNGNASRVFLGHNRSATRGAINTANSHPFTFDHITGAHNGTLDKESWDRLEDKLGENYAVDSMALIASIAKFGIEKTIKMCTEGKTATDGAWALVWYDRNENTVNFLRNKHRPLWYAYEGKKDENTPGFQRMFWASEYWMIREAMTSSAAGYKIYTQPDSTVGFFDFDTDVHYKYDLDALCAGGDKPPKPKCKKIKGKEPSQQTAIVPFPRPTSQSGEGSGTYTGSVGKTKSQNTSGRSHTSNTSTTTSRGTSNKRDCLQLTGSLTRPYAGIIDEAKFSHYQQGCFWCRRPITFGDEGISLYERDKIMLCAPCGGHPSTVKIYVPGPVIDALS